MPASPPAKRLARMGPPISGAGTGDPETGSSEVADVTADRPLGARHGPDGPRRRPGTPSIDCQTVEDLTVRVDVIDLDTFLDVRGIRAERHGDLVECIAGEIGDHFDALWE